MEQRDIIPVGSLAKLRKDKAALKSDFVKPMCQLEHALSGIDMSLDFFQLRVAPPAERKMDDLNRLPVLVLTTDEDKKQLEPYEL